MARRIVLFGRKPDASQEEFAARVGALDVLKHSVDGISGWWLTVQAADAGAWQAALIIDFRDSDSRSAYDSHPDHVRLGGAVAEMASFAIFDTTA